MSQNPAARVTPALSVDSLSFSVRHSKAGQPDQPILRDLTLQVKTREFVSIVGPSGCGKSTLLNFVAGLQHVQSGSITFASDSRDGVTPLGYMFQQHALLPWLTVQKNVELGLDIAGIAAPEQRQRAAATIADMGLAGYEDHYPSQISGGMCQRVSLARTLVTNPDLILMDEPFGALDAQTRIFIQQMFSRYWEEHKKTVLLVTHDLAEAIFLSDRILVMGARPGRIVAEYAVNIPRPRDADSLRTSPEFNILLSALWQEIKRYSQFGGGAHDG